MDWLRGLFGPRWPCRRRVIVNTREQAFRGILWERTREHLVLRNAEVLKAKDEVVRMDGEVVIERARVEFIQVLT